MSHTPGPWTLEPNRAIGAKCFTGETKYVCDHVRGGSPEEAEANARLIAGAPQLLDALRGVKRLFAESSSTFYIKKLGAPITNGDQALIDDVFIAVGSAITRATGGAE